MLYAFSGVMCSVRFVPLAELSLILICMCVSDTTVKKKKASIPIKTILLSYVIDWK